MKRNKIGIGKFLLNLTLWALVIFGLEGMTQEVQGQGITNINVTGISPIIEEPFTDRFEQNFRNGRYQVIFTYNNSNPSSVDFRFKFRLTRGGEEIIEVISAPKSFRPGAYVFTSVFEDLPFEQTFEEVINQVDNDLKKQVVQEGIIPEGSYVLNIEAIPEREFSTISSPPSVNPFTVRYPQAPVLINPADESNLTLETPVFNWTPVVGFQGYTMQYEFLLVEVFDSQTPLQALRSNRAHAQRTLTDQISLAYTPEFLPLEDGKKYAWQITATTNTGSLPIKNDGKSEIRTFTYKGTSSEISASDLKKIPLQKNFAVLTKLQRLEVEERGNSLLLNGPATLEVSFADRSTPYQVDVDVRDLRIQKGSLDMPVITNGFVAGKGQFFEEMLGEASDYVDLNELRWSVAKGLTANASLVTPDESTINAKGDLYLTRAGIKGTVTAEGKPLASLGSSPLELRLTKMRARFPGGNIRGTGHLRTLDDVNCTVPYLSLTDTFRVGVDCDIDESVPLVGDSDRLVLGMESATGQLSGSWSDEELEYDLNFDSKLGIKLKDEQYCENAADLSLSSEDGLSVDNVIPGCVAPEPTIDLGILQLAFSNLNVESFDYDQQSSNWDFDLSFDAELFFPTAPNMKLPPLQEVHLIRRGIQFPKSDFGKPDLRSLGDIAIDQVKFRLEKFLMDRFTFPWFEWRKKGIGPWDFAFDASMQLPDNPIYPSCLTNTALQVRGAHVEDRGDGNRVVAGDITVDDFKSCAWNFGAGNTLNVEDLSGRLIVNYLNGKFDANSQLSVKGGLSLGEPFDCGSGDQLDLAETDLTISNGLNGRIKNIVPKCPIEVGPYTARITSSSLDFSYSQSRGQKAIMDARAELEISDQKSAKGDIRADLMQGTIDSANFEIQGPFEWGIPKENPVLTFRIDKAKVTDQGFFVDGRQELLIKDETIGATFDQLLLDWNTFEVKEGSIILDETFSFQAGIDSVSKQLDYQAALGDTTLAFSPGLLMNLAGTVKIDTLGLHTSGTAQTALDFGGIALDSLEVNYTKNFAMGLKPFGIKRGKAELFWKNQRVAYADNSGFHPDIGFFGNQFLPDRLPLPTERVAYIQLKKNDQLVVNTTKLQNGDVRIETKANTPLKLVLPALKGNQPQAPEVAVSLNNVRVNPSTGNYVSGTITANIPQNDSRFDLDRLNVPLLVKKIEFAKRNVNGNLVDRLFLDGNLKLFEKDLGSGGSVSLFVDSNGDVKGNVDLPNLNASVPLDSNSNRVVAKLDSLGGAVTGIPLLNGGQPQFSFNIKGGFQINDQNGNKAARAGLGMRFDDQGLAVTNFQADALQDTASLDLGVFGFDISNISSLNLGYSEQNGFSYFAALDFALRLNLPNQKSMAFPLKNVEIRDDIGFVIPQQDIHNGSTPRLNAPPINLGKFQLKPLALRMSKDTLNWHDWSPGDLVDLLPKVDMELSFPGFQNTAPELSQVSITLQDIGFNDGVFSGSMLPIDRTNDPIFLPIGSEAGISIDGITGGLLDPGDGTQGFDIKLSGYFDMPSFFMAQGQTCNQTRVDVNLSKAGGLSGTVQNFLPCGNLELGPLALAFGQSTLDLSFSKGAQQATLAGAATADIQRENASPITASGNLTFDLLNGKVLNGNVGINQQFDWYFPSNDSLFTFEVQSARIDTAGLVFTGGGSMKAGNGSVSVNFNDLAFSLADGSLSYGSAQIQNNFALDIAFNPAKWAINSPSDSLRADPGVRLTMPKNLVLNKNGLQVNGSSGAALRYGDESYSNLNLDFVNMMIGFDPVGVTSGRADFMLDEKGEDPVRLAWYDSQGFHPDNIAGGVPLPDTLGLPSKDVAYIVLKDENGNNLVQSSAVSDGLSLSTNQPVSLVLASITDSNGDHPTVDISFSDIVINGAYKVISGSITADLSSTPLNLSNYGNYPFGLMALHFEKKQQGDPYKMYVDAKMDLPQSLNDLAVLLEKIALGPDGFEQTTIAFGSYTTAHTEGNTPTIASHSFSNNALTMALRGAELEFGTSNSYRLSGDISSNFLQNANGDSAVVHFAADYSNSNWKFALDTDHLTPQEFPIGQGKLILDDIKTDISQQEFAVVLDGRFALSGIAGDDLEVGLQGLRVGTQGVSIDNVNTSGLTPQSLSLFGDTDNMTISSLDVQLTSQNHLMLEMDGSLSFLNRTFNFNDFKLGSDGTFAMGNGGVNLIDPQDPVQLMDHYFELTELSIGIQNSKAALTASGDVTLPSPFSSTSSMSLTVDHTGQVSSSGPQFVLNDASVNLGDIASLDLTGVGLEINDISTPDITLYGSADVTIDGKTIAFGSPGSPTDWGIRYKLGSSASQGLEWNSPTNHPTFTFDASFFSLTIKQIELLDNTGKSFGLSLNTSAAMQLNGIGGSLDLNDFQISSTGIKSMGKVTGGGLNIAEVVSIELGSFDWKKDTTVEIERQDGTKENPGSKVEQIQVEEYLSFSRNSGQGGNAVEITIPGGFSGSINEILYYKTSNSLYLNIDGVDISLSDYAQLYASLEYEKRSSGFRLKVAGGGEIKAGGQTYGLAAMGRMSNINQQFSFGIFVSVQAEVPIVPGVITLTKAGGGFFYKASNQDFNDVMALSDYELYNDKAPWDDESESYDFAIALNAGAGIVGTTGGYAVSGETMILITDQWFALDVRGEVLNQGNSFQGGMYLTARWSPAFQLNGGVGLDVDYSGIITGNLSLDFYVKKNSQDKTIWAIDGDGNLDIIGGISAESKFMVSPDGFYVEVDVSKGFDIWVISINSNFNGSIWWIYNEQFGAYMEIGFDASLFGGAASIGGTLKGALIVDNGYLVYASASAHVSVFMVFNGRVSVWVSVKDGKFDGGKGSNGAYESMIEDAKQQAQDMEDKMNEAANAAKEMETQPDIMKMSDNELAAAGANILNSGSLYQNLMYVHVILKENDITDPIPTIYDDIRQNVVNSDRPQESDYNLEPLRSDMVQKIDFLTQQASGAQTRLQQFRTAAIQWDAQAEEMVENVINSPVKSSKFGWQGKQPPSFDIDKTQAANNQGSLEKLKRDVEKLDQKYRAVIDSISANIDRIDEALSFKLSGLQIQQGLNNTYVVSGDAEYHPSANMVSESYVDATKAIDKFYGNYISYLWSTHYWAKQNYASLENLRSGGTNGQNPVKEAVISASESQLQSLGVDIDFYSEDNVNVGQFNPTYGIKSKVKDVASARYYNLLKANPDYTDDQASTKRSSFTNEMENYWSNGRYPSFFGNFVQKGIEFWYKTPKLGYESIRQTSLNEAEALADKYNQDNLDKLQGAHENFTALVDDIYEIKASMSTTLHGLLDVYIAWKSDTTVTASDSSITALKQQKQELEQKLAAPQISNIYYTKTLSEYSNKVKFNWNVEHPTGDIAENSYTLNKGSNASVFARDMISTGNDTEVTRYLFKEEESQKDKHYNLTVRARGPAGVAISKPASFRVAVDEYLSGYGSHESGGVTDKISSADNTPPSRPMVGIDLETTTTYVQTESKGLMKKPISVPVESYWTKVNDELTFSTLSVDSESDIAGFEYAIGSTKGGTDIRDWTTGYGERLTQGESSFANMAGVDNFAQKITIQNLDMETGKAYYLSVRSVNGDSLKSTVKELSKPIRYDDTNPTTPKPKFQQAAMGYGLVFGMGTQTRPSVTEAPDMMGIPDMTKREPEISVLWQASSDIGSGLKEYQYVVSTESDPFAAFEGDADIHHTSSTSVTVTGEPLTFSDSVYVHIRAVDYTGRYSNDALTYGPILPEDPTKPNAPVISASVKPDGPGFYLVRPSLDLETNVEKYQYSLGTSASAQDVVGWRDLDMSSKSLLLGLWKLSAVQDIEWPDQKAQFVDIPADNLTDGQEVYLHVRTVNGQEVESNKSTSGPIIYDSTPPENPSISLQTNSSDSDLTISVSNIQDTESGVTKVEYKVIDTTEKLPYNRIIKGWNDFMQINGTQSGSLSGSKTVDVSGHLFMGLKVYIRITNGNGRQTTVTKQPTMNNYSKTQNNYNYNFNTNF